LFEANELVLADQCIWYGGEVLTKYQVVCVSTLSLVTALSANWRSTIFSAKLSEALRIKNATHWGSLRNIDWSSTLSSCS